MGSWMHGSDLGVAPAGPMNAPMSHPLGRGWPMKQCSPLSLLWPLNLWHVFFLHAQALWLQRLKARGGAAAHGKAEPFPEGAGGYERGSALRAISHACIQALVYIISCLNAGYHVCVLLFMPAKPACMPVSSSLLLSERDPGTRHHHAGPGGRLGETPRLKHDLHACTLAREPPSRHAQWPVPLPS